MDKYAELRAALAAGPTPGPWRAEMVYDAGYAHINFDSRERNTLRGFCGEANAEYIASCHPETIRALLAERDALREVLTELVETAKLYGLREDDYIIYQARAALAQEQGEKHDNKS